MQAFNMERQYEEFQVAMHGLMTRIAYPWKFVVKKLRAKEFLAEFLGTFILCTIGNCAIAQTVLSENSSYGTFGTFHTINIGYALGLVIAIYVSIEASGAHLNPAVSWAMALRGKLSWLLIIPYMIAQMLGAFFSSAVVYGVYHDGIHKVDGDLTLKTAGIFATYPAPYLTVGNGFFDQVLGTFFLVIGILAIVDPKNHEVKSGLKPLLIGFVLWAIGSSLGMNAGYAVNPARDLGPRIFTAMAGYGVEVFDCSKCSISHWWWIPIVAPFVGATVAVMVYWSLIEAHQPGEEERVVIAEGGRMRDGEGYLPINEKEPLTLSD